MVTPASACGGSALLSFAAQGATIIAVEENTTKMQVRPEDLAIKAIRVRSYLEAVGVIIAQKAGISLPSLSPYFPSLGCLN